MRQYVCRKRSTFSALCGISAYSCECSFVLGVGEKLIIKKERGAGGPALKVTDDGRGQLGHLQRELVPVLACFPVLIVTLSILNHFNNKDFCHFRVNWNIFVFKLLHTHTQGDLSDQLKMNAFCLYAKQNRTNRIDWVPVVRLSSLIELTEKFQFNYVRLLNQSNYNRTDWVRWVRLIFGSVSFD